MNINLSSNRNTLKRCYVDLTATKSSVFSLAFNGPMLGDRDGFHVFYEILSRINTWPAPFSTRGKFRSRHTYGLAGGHVTILFPYSGNGRPVDTNCSGNFLKNTMMGLPIFTLFCNCNHDCFLHGV